MATVAILTKFHGPTDTKGARISARADGRPTKFYSFPYEGSNANDIIAEQYFEEVIKAPGHYISDDAYLTHGTLPNHDGCHIITFPK